MHRHPPTLSQQLSSADNVFLHKVQKALEAEMLEYIPLDLLTDEACRHMAREPPMPESAFVISNRKLRLPNASFNVSKESKLFFDEWISAGANLVAAICKNLHADGDCGAGGPIALEIADFFEGHFKYLKNLPDVKMQFDVVFDYNRRLHSLFVLDSHTFCIDDFHSHVWQECLNQQYAARVTHLDNKLAPFCPNPRAKTHRTTFPFHSSTILSPCINSPSALPVEHPTHKLIACCWDAKFLHKDGKM